MVIEDFAFDFFILNIKDPVPSGMSKPIESCALAQILRLQLCVQDGVRPLSVNSPPMLRQKGPSRLPRRRSLAWQRSLRPFHAAQNRLLVKDSVQDPIHYRGKRVSPPVVVLHRKGLWHRPFVLSFVVPLAAKQKQAGFTNNSAESFMFHGGINSSAGSKP